MARALLKQAGNAESDVLPGAHRINDGKALKDEERKITGVDGRDAVMLITNRTGQQHLAKTGQVRHFDLAIWSIRARPRWV